ncbi:MAG: NUDIX domain-containing protein [Actinomycetota bacterium]|nr:NUDIX domain-containing protein [Actinomycetota bacterium]
MHRSTSPAPTDRLVVGAAIVSHGRVVAARRTNPVALAGGWEFPGGKVDAGETPEQACVREVHEELGCVIRVVGELSGRAVLRPGWILQVLVAELAEAEPVPHEHDAIRWLDPEELLDWPWLAADAPFLPELRELLLDGSPLVGGNVGGAVRIGHTVRRPRGAWSPGVHALLEHLAAAGLDGVPRVLGTDVRGREVLTYLPGRSIDVDEEVAAEEVLAGAVRWLRRFHDAVRDFTPPAGTRWRNGGDLGPGQLVCHHDAGAYNWAVVDEHFAGIYDWDMAGPGTALDDLAFAAWNSVPLFRPVPDDDVARRLRLMVRAYGAYSPVGVLDAVEARISLAADKIAAGQRAGDPGMLNLARVGEPQRTLDRLGSLRMRLPGLRAALQ